MVRQVVVPPYSGILLSSRKGVNCLSIQQLMALRGTVLSRGSLIRLHAAFLIRLSYTRHFWKDRQRRRADEWLLRGRSWRGCDDEGRAHFEGWGYSPTPWPWRWLYRPITCVKAIQLCVRGSSCIKAYKLVKLQRVDSECWSNPRPSLVTVRQVSRDPRGYCRNTDPRCLTRSAALDPSWLNTNLSLPGQPQASSM